jgi:hypothetical protein
MEDRLSDRVAELEAELKRRDDKIKELTKERDEAQELVDQMREHTEVRIPTMSPADSEMMSPGDTK